MINCAYLWGLSLIQIIHSFQGKLFISSLLKFLCGFFPSHRFNFLFCCLVVGRWRTTHTWCHMDSVKILIPNLRDKIWGKKEIPYFFIGYSVYFINNISRAINHGSDSKHFPSQKARKSWAYVMWGAYNLCTPLKFQSVNSSFADRHQTHTISDKSPTKVVDVFWSYRHQFFPQLL